MNGFYVSIYANIVYLLDRNQSNLVVSSFLSVITVTYKGGQCDLKYI